MRAEDRAWRWLVRLEREQQVLDKQVVSLEAIVAAYEVLLGAAMSSPGSSSGPS
jgi:hypothetical protein